MPTTKRSPNKSQPSSRGRLSSRRKPSSRGKKGKGADARTVIFAGAATLALALAAAAVLLVGKTLVAPSRAAEETRPAAATAPAAPTEPAAPTAPVATTQAAPAHSAPTASEPTASAPSLPAKGALAAPETAPEATLRPASGVEAPARRLTQLKSPTEGKPDQKPPARAPIAGAKPSAQTKNPASYRRPMEPRPAQGRGGKLVFIIDDVGNNLSQLEPFLKAPFPLTFAILPGLPYSSQAAARIKAAGKDFILHQPMEALGGQNPGPGAIYLSTPPGAAARIVEENLDSLPGALGLNNHEGSAVTRNSPLMEAILGVAKSRGIYYLDSLTIAGTATQAAARREGIRYWERDVFLDNSPDRESIVHYIDVGKKKAEQGGSAVMIGHVWSAHLAATLMELYPQLVDEGFSLSTISELMLEESHADPRD